MSNPFYSKPSYEFHYTVDIELEGKTLRFADQGLFTTGDIYYDGRARISNVDWKIPSPESQESVITSYVRIELDNHDGALTEDFTTREWAWKTVTVKLGQGSPFQAMGTIFEGLIRFPDGLQFTGNSIRITVTSKAYKSCFKKIPKHTFENIYGSNAEERARKLFIPIVYGSWTGGRLPAYWVSASLAPRIFKICEGPIKSIGTVYRNGEDVSDQVGSKNPDQATFEFWGSYDETKDQLTVDVEGRKKIDGTLIENPADIIEDLLYNFAGYGLVADSNLNEIRSWTIQLRGYLDEPDTILHYILQVAADCNLDFFEQAGLFYLHHRNDTTFERTFDKSDWEKNSYQSEYDPDRLYCNKLIVHYAWNPRDSKFESEYSNQNSGEVTVVGEVKKELKSHWHYIQTGATPFFDWKLNKYSGRISVFNPTILFRGLDLELGQNVKLTGANAEGKLLQIREFNLHLKKIPKVSMSLWHWP